MTGKPERQNRGLRTPSLLCYAFKSPRARWVGKIAGADTTIANMKRLRGRPKHADLLTPSEWRTVHAIQHGMSNAEIARRRGVSVNAVKFHLTNALGKLNLRNRRELRAWFRAPQGRISMAEEMKLGPIGQIARSV